MSSRILGYTLSAKVFEKIFLTKVWWSLYHTRDKTKFQTLQRILSIPTLSPVSFYCGIDDSRDKFKYFMESELRGKVGSFFDITRITWLFRHHIIRSLEMQKIQLSMWPKRSYIGPLEIILDYLCQSRETLKRLLIKINFTFFTQKLRIFWNCWNLLRSQFLNLEQFFLKLCQKNYMHVISTNFETGLTRYNVCTLIPQLSLYMVMKLIRIIMIPQLSLYLWFSPS